MKITINKLNNIINNLEVGNTIPIFPELLSDVSLERLQELEDEGIIDRISNHTYIKVKNK